MTGPQPVAAPAAGSDAENADPSDEGSLRKMFVQGTEQIETKRCVPGPLQHPQPAGSNQGCCEKLHEGRSHGAPEAVPPLPAAAHLLLPLLLILHGLQD